MEEFTWKSLSQKATNSRAEEYKDVLAMLDSVGEKYLRFSTALFLEVRFYEQSFAESGNNVHEF